MSGADLLPFFVCVMGLFDYLRCLAPLPDGSSGDHEFQTKDTPEQMLASYTITADGLLVHNFVEYRWVDDARSLIGGYLRPDMGTRRDVTIPFHGDIRFYTTNLAASGPQGFATINDEPPCFREYVARFTEGRLARIEGGVDPSAFADRTHLPRSHFFRGMEVPDQA
jgi:hypothetical protein